MKTYSNSLALMAVSGVSAALFGCAVGVEESSEGSGGRPSVVATTQEALDSCNPTYSGFNVAHNTTWVAGHPTSTHLCWPTRFDIPPVGWGPRLLVQPINGKWQAQGWGRMECVTQCAFFSNGGSSDVRWTSQIWNASAWEGTIFGEDFDEAQMWFGDAAAIITGIHHSADNSWDFGYNSRREWARLARVGQVFERTRLQANTYNGASDATGNNVYGVSYFVGRPDTNHQLNFQILQERSGLGEWPLIPASQGICTFYDIRGVMPDSVPRLFRNAAGDWRLQIQGTSNWASAQPVCYMFNQNQ